jgi:hypothetical protein
MIAMVAWDGTTSELSPDKYRLAASEEEAVFHVRNISIREEILETGEKYVDM